VSALAAGASFNLDSKIYLIKNENLRFISI
jgi:hypothetical protein